MNCHYDTFCVTQIDAKCAIMTKMTILRIIVLLGMDNA
jgi:hypothetical protein